MELFGGLGFLEDFAVSRLHREALVTAIWEGTSNIQALDLLESIHKKSAHEPFLDEFMPLLEGVGEPAARLAAGRIQGAFTQLATLGPAEAQWYAKDTLSTLADATQVALLYSLAEADERYARLARLYAARFLENQPYPAWALNEPRIWWPWED
jgi:hypothetical protein